MLGKIAAIAILGGVGEVAALNNVSDAVPADQKAAAQSLMQGVRPAPGFDGEVAFISAVQDRVLRAAPINRGIPAGYPRELTDLLKAHHGWCYDRSRAIETVLRTYGFEARHVSIFSTAKTHSTLESLVTRRVPSHVLTEVRTDRGWLLVDPNRRWIGLTADGKLSGLRNISAQKWRKPPARILRHPYIYVRGLYSRHGRFYPPYDPIPDVNWPELVGA